MPRSLASRARTTWRGSRRLAPAGAALLAAASLASCAGGGASTAGVTWAGRDVVTAAAYRVPGGRAAPPGTAVLTQRGSNSRAGWNGHETILNSHNVSAASFGKRVAYPVDGKIYAQPLFVPALRAYAAGDLARELYSSQQDPGRDAIPGYDNFCLPTVTDGRVFVGTSGELLIYGLLHQAVT
jgi:hypothetical protein